jgi:ankyrin repeat protein
MSDFDHPLTLELYRAARRGRLAEIKRLMAQGASPRSSIRDGRDLVTPVHGACDRNQSEVLEFFLSDPDIDPNCPGNSSQRYMPLQRACKRGAWNAVSVLLKHPRTSLCHTDGEGVDPISYALHECHSRAAEMLLESRLPLPKIGRFNDGSPWFNMACFRGSPKLVEMMRADPSISVTQTGGGHRSALHYACEGANPAIVKILLSDPRTNDVTARDAKGATPLLAMVQRLTKGQFAFEKEFKSRHVAVIELLLASPGIEATWDDLVRFSYFRTGPDMHREDSSLGMLMTDSSCPEQVSVLLKGFHAHPGAVRCALRQKHNLA